MADTPIIPPPSNIQQPSEPGAVGSMRAGIILVASFLWRWEVVAVGATAIFIAGGIGAIYGDDFDLARSFFFLAIAWLTVKTLSWSEVREHKDRLWASLVIVALGIFAIYGSTKWIQDRAETVRAKTQPTNVPATSTDGAKPVTSASTLEHSSPASADKPQPEAISPHAHMAQPKDGGIRGSENTVVGDHRPVIGDRNTIVAAGANGNVSIPGGTAIGAGAKAGPTSVAIGAGAGSVAGVTTGPCSNVQVGGFGNSATTNCGPIERHLTPSQKATFVTALKDKQVSVTFNALVNVPDAQQFAFELCAAAKEAIPATDCNDIRLVMERGGTPWVGVKFAFKGEVGREGVPISVADDSPVGIIEGAFVAANITRGVGHPDPHMKDDAVTVIVGSPPKD
jgi:hypothetical protein